MGWYTELKIGDNYWNWRKALPVEVPLLFFGKHKIVGADIEDATFDSDDFIGYEATVGQVISNLDQLGLTLEFFISTYATYRKDLVSWGLVHLSSMKKAYQVLGDHGDSEKAHIKEIDGWIKKVKNGNASSEIKSAIELLKNGIDIDSSLINDDSLIPSLNNVRMDVNLNEPNVLEAVTFGIFLSYAYDNLPEIAWLYEVRLILETKRKRSKVKLDMKEWVLEGGSLEIIEDSIQSLGLKAKTYSKTFNALLGGSETYSKEFERIQLIEKWRSLTELKKDDLSKGTKLEEFIVSLFHKKYGFIVVAKNLLVETQELDIVLRNTSQSDFIKYLNSPFLLVECKNWSTPVGVREARVFESKYREAGQKVNLGIFVAINGVTKPFKSHLNNLIREGINVIVIDENEIDNFLYSENLNINFWIEDIISRQFVLK